MTKQKTVSEAVSKLDDAVKTLGEVRQNLADQDVGDDLLTLIDKGIQEVKEAHVLLNSN